MPFTQLDSLLQRLSSVTSYYDLSEDEKMEYDADLKAYRDIRGQLEYAKKEGYAKGFLGAFAERFAKICGDGDWGGVGVACDMAMGGAAYVLWLSR